jgi:hypothetical protein
MAQKISVLKHRYLWCLSSVEGDQSLLVVDGAAFLLFFEQKKVLLNVGPVSNRPQQNVEGEKNSLQRRTLRCERYNLLPGFPLKVRK